jgi:flagellar motility protein MotE (MotC chaperone)
LYKQVIQQIEESQEVQDYAAAYAAMKPAKAAAIFEELTSDLELAARILGVMSEDDRGNVLGAMDPVIAAKITKIMEPDG